MKSFNCIIFFVVLSTLIISCKKQNDFSFNSKELIGTWQWVRTDGGFAFNIHETPASTGKNVGLTLTSDYKYYFITNDTLTSQGTFSIKTEKSIFVHKDRAVIVFSKNQAMMVQNVDKDTLRLSDNAYDGVGSLYIRKNVSQQQVPSIP